MVRTRRCAPSQDPSRTQVHRTDNTSSRSRNALSRTKTVPRPQYVTIDGQRLPVSVVLDTLYWFMAERHRIFERRVAREPGPWTDDFILAAYPFTNVFRVYDRTTQYILRHVIGEGDEDLHETCFRIMLFRSFNKMETWQHLKSCIGDLTWRTFDVRRYEQALETVPQAIYGHAYIIPAPKLGGYTNAANHLRLVQLMMEENLPDHLLKFCHLKDAHGWLSLFPSMGEFTSLQLLLDLNMLPEFGFDEDEWVALGPGSLQCIRKIFGPGVRGREYEAFKYLHATQHEHFARLGIYPDRIPRLFYGRRAGVTMVDLEHSLCECEKYCRARHPTILGKRKKVAKHSFVPRVRYPTADLPEHWVISHASPLKLTRPPPISLENRQPLYEVSHILAEKGNKQGPVQYLVRWAGYGPDDDTWQQEGDLAQGAELVLDEWKSTKERMWKRVTEMQTSGLCVSKDAARAVIEVKGKYLW